MLQFFGKVVTVWNREIFDLVALGKVNSRENVQFFGHFLQFFIHVFISTFLIKGELHSNYIFLYFILIGLEYYSVTLFKKTNIFFLSELTFQLHLHKIYKAFYLLT